MAVEVSDTLQSVGLDLYATAEFAAHHQAAWIMDY
jgi:hypothetical protein